MLIKKDIPIFFATDDKYAPFLAISLKSMLKNASTKYFYKVYVLMTKLSEESQKTILSAADNKCSVKFVSIQKELDKISSLLHLRDYYSKETYYRFFIANLFPQYKKVLYLDCDIVVTGDISELYKTDIRRHLVAAVADDAVPNVPVFCTYVENALGIESNKYFNAGILLINTQKFRKEKICNQFVSLINRFTFRVAQDQDYLNVICKDRVKYVNPGWNKKAEKDPDFYEGDLRLVHYKLGFKPWHYDGIAYEDLFWNAAKEAGLYDQIKELKDNYTDEQKIKDQKGLERLLEMCEEDSMSPNNYVNTMYANAGEFSKKPGEYKKLIAANPNQKTKKNVIKLWMIEIPVAIGLAFFGIPGWSAIAIYYGWKGFRLIRRNYKKNQEKKNKYGN